MTKLIFFFLIGYCLYLLFRKSANKSVESRQGEVPKGEIAHKDPVCGVYVTEEDAVIGRYEGERIYFCSRECLEKFRESLEEKSS